MFVEIIYETGSHSIAYYKDEEEAKRALDAHMERAVNGQTILANHPEVGLPAERIKKVLKYDKHPADYMADQTMSSDVAAKTIADAVKEVSEGGVVHLPELAAAVNEMSYPMVESGPHESNFKMKEVGELGWKWTGDK